MATEAIGIVISFDLQSTTGMWDDASSFLGVNASPRQTTPSGLGVSHGCT